MERMSFGETKEQGWLKSLHIYDCRPYEYCHKVLHNKYCQCKEELGQSMDLLARNILIKVLIGLVKLWSVYT